MSQPQGAHLVGSINLDDAETTMRIAAHVLGDRLKRIPDGEVGERFHWIGFQPDRIAQADGIERVGDVPIPLHTLDLRQVRIAEGRTAGDIRLGSLGYADAALESWQTFSALKRDGVIPERTRFQVSLPTPLGVVASFVAESDREAFEPVYEAALAAELTRIVEAVPHAELAIQWDAALEFAILEGASYTGTRYEWFDDVWAETSSRLARQIDRVPTQVEVGVHLCYGDVAEKHFVEPHDTSKIVRFAGLVVAAASRRLTWVHLPVPIDRADDAYFAPLEELEIHDATELYLGLAHREDGPEGAQRRIETAERHVRRAFGVATECGFGRAPEGTTIPLFETHRAVTTAW